MALIALFFGLVVAFSGYRLFLVLLPIWGFFAGFFLGAQTIQFLFNESFLETATAVVVGFVVGAIFAILSYLFYVAAVAIIGFWAGYAGTVAIFGWIGLDPGFLIWLLGVVVGVILAGVVLRFNLAKIAIIIITAIGGTSLIVYTLLAVFRGIAFVTLLENPVKLALDNSFWWLIFFLIVAVLGAAAQFQANKDWEVETYNRLEAGA